MGQEPGTGKVTPGIDAGFLSGVVKALAGNPPLVLIFGVVTVIFVTVGTALGAVWLGIAVILSLVLVFLAVWMSLRQQRSVVLPSTEAAQGVAARVEHRAVVEALLEGICDPRQDVYFVYSSLTAAELVDHGGQNITHLLDDDERRITTLYDVQGISAVEALVREARRDPGGGSEGEERLHHVNGFLWDNQWLGHHVLLIGGPSANPSTLTVLDTSGSPFGFALKPTRRRDSLPQITEGSGQYGPWPPEPEKGGPGRPPTDYGILAKFKKRQRDTEVVYLIAAGLGSHGTLGACMFLHDNVEDLHRSFGSDSFVCVIAAPEGQPQEARKEIAAVLRDAEWRFTQA